MFDKLMTLKMLKDLKIFRCISTVENVGYLYNEIVYNNSRSFTSMIFIVLV